jgi:hypothetical protein
LKLEPGSEAEQFVEIPPLEPKIVQGRLDGLKIRPNDGRGMVSNNKYIDRNTPIKLNKDFRTTT